MSTQYTSYTRIIIVITNIVHNNENSKKSLREKKTTSDYIENDNKSTQKHSTVLLRYFCKTSVIEPCTCNSSWTFSCRAQMFELYYKFNVDVNFVNNGHY